MENYDFNLTFLILKAFFDGIFLNRTMPPISDSPPSKPETKPKKAILIPAASVQAFQEKVKADRKEVGGTDSSEPLKKDIEAVTEDTLARAEAAIQAAGGGSDRVDYDDMLSDRSANAKTLDQLIEGDVDLTMLVKTRAKDKLDQAKKTKAFASIKDRFLSQEKTEVKALELAIRLASEIATLDIGKTVLEEIKTLLIKRGHSCDDIISSQKGHWARFTISGTQMLQVKDAKFTLNGNPVSTLRNIVGKIK